MRMQRVQSTNVHSIGYDPTTRALRVRFLDAQGTAPGPTYEYADVPAHRYDALLHAPSKGGYLHSHIKPHHPHTRIRPQDHWPEG